MADFTESEDAGMCSSSFSGAWGKETLAGASGCLALRLFMVAWLQGAKVSPEDSSRMAPLKSFSANLALILFFKISS